MPCWRRLRLEKGSAFGGIVTELVAEDTKSTWGVGEPAGNLDRGTFLDEVSAQGLILAVEWIFRGEEEASLG